MSKKVQFTVEKDKSYVHAFVSGLEISAISPTRIDLSFYYELANKPSEFTSDINEKGEAKASNDHQDPNLIKLKRIIKADISLDKQTVVNMIHLLQEHLKKM